MAAPDKIPAPPPDDAAPARIRRLAREQASQLRRAVAEAPFPVFVYAEDGEILHVSRAVTELTGYAAEELPTVEAWTERAYGERAPEIRALIAQRFELEGRVEMGEFAIRTKDGGERVWAFSSSSLGRDSAGRRLLISVAADLTERKRMEAALRESEERLRLAQQAARVGTWDLDLATGEVVWSEEVFELAGLSPEEGVPSAEAWEALLHPEDRARVERQIRAAIEAGGTYESEFRIVRPDGEVRWLAAQGRVSHGPDGRPARLLGVNFDVTARKRAEAERAARARQQAAVADFGLFTLHEPDREAIFRHACEVVAGTLGTDTTEVLELLPHRRALRLRAGTGWPEGVVGAATVPSDDGSQAGFTLHAREPVRAEDLGAEERFTPPPLLTEHGLVSGMSVVIGPHDRPFGVLGAHTRARRSFADADADFLQAIAHVLWAAIERDEAQRRLHASNAALEQVVTELQRTNEALEARVEERAAALRQHEALLSGILMASLDGVAALEAVRDEAGAVVDLVWTLVNPAAAAIAGRAPDHFVGRRYLDLVRSAEGRRLFEEAVRVIEARRSLRRELPYDADGVRGWFDFAMVPLGDGIAVTFRDITRQKEAAEALRRSERRFRELFEASPDAIFVEGLDGVVLDANPAACRLHRADRAWLIGRPVHDLVPEGYRDLVRADFERLVAGKIGVLESYSLATDGEVVPVEVRADRITFDHRDALLLHVRDITERKQAEQALRERESQFATAFRAAPFAIAISTVREGRYVDVNEAYCRLVGLPHDAIAGHTVVELGLVAAEERDRRRDEFVRSASTRDLEVRIRRADGGTRDVIASVETIEISGVPCFLSMMHDVTERRQAEQALRESEERFSKAFRSAPVAVSISTLAEGRFIDANPAYCALTGYAPDELIGQSAGALSVWESLQERAAVVERLLRDGSVRNREVRIRTKGGALRDLLASMEVIELGGEACILAIAHDVTERKRLEREVIEAAEQERRRIGQDLHDDLGQQLTGAAFLSQVLQRKLERARLPEAAEAGQLTELLNQTLAETRGLSRILSPVDIQAAGLTDALHELAHQARTLFGMACEFHAHGEVGLTDNAAATHLYRIAQEAVNNAVKHASASAIVVALTRRRGHLCLRVEDDGVGVPEHALQGGNGIGLRTMRYRADLIGASFAIGRGPGGGTVVECRVAEG